MTIRQQVIKRRSAERLAFEHYLRTGRRLRPDEDEGPAEQKFNPYHDPRNGQFTFGPGGPRSLRGAPAADHSGISRPRPLDRRKPVPTGNDGQAPSPATVPTLTPTIYVPQETPAHFLPAQYRPNPRGRIGGNGGPPLNDPMTLQQVFPGLTAAPGGALLAMADNFLDLSGPAARLTTELTNAHANLLIEQIRRIDPNYWPDMPGFETTLEGQANRIRRLRLDRAVAFYRTRGETRPLQVEVLRYLQERTDRAYEQGIGELERGRLKVRLSREEALGNYIDRTVRRDLQNLYNVNGIATSTNGPIRIIGREYTKSGNERSYRIPDARVGKVAFDISLTRKTGRTPQVQGFFSSDWKPDTVIIVRPSQLGPNSTYAITRQER